MGVLSTLSFIVGGLFLISIVFIPIAWVLWKWHIRKIKRKVGEFLELKVADVVIEESEDLNDFIKIC